MSMPINLNKRRILIGVSGSIAIYKTCELIRLFIKAGAEVKVVMTPSAKRFIPPLTFEALTRNRVLDESSEEWSSDLNHIDITKWAEIFIIAPATANTINKLAKGIADNILLECALAFNKSLLIAPSANTNMLKNHYTEGSLKMLKVNDTVIIEPQKKLLACGDEGVGALAEPLEIFYHGARELLKEEFWEDRKVVVTGGGTKEKIDAVRYITNRSSGKMADALASALWLKGADVCYIRANVNDSLPNKIYTIDINSALELKEYLVDCIRVAKKGVMSKPSLNNPNPIGMIQKKPYLFMASAVSDYRVRYPQDSKIKKSDIGDTWKLELVKNPDIISEIDKSGIISIAFKAETNLDEALKSAKETLEAKGVDAICYNYVGEGGAFESDRNRVIFVTKEAQKDLGESSKIELSFKILKESKGLDSE